MGDRRSGGRGGGGGGGGGRRSGDDFRNGRSNDSRGPRPDRGSGGGGGGRGEGGPRSFGGGGGGGGSFNLGFAGGDGQRLKPMPNLDDIDATKKKFTGRCRLFVGNLPTDMQEEELKKLFEEFGEIAECFMSGKGFAFIRLDTRAHAEAAKESLDSKNVRNRTLRVRFAVHGAALRVKELSPYVSNELLFQAFSQFGEVERAVHIVDEKGRPIGEGIVEFARKGGALETLRRVSDGVFLLTGDPRPVTVEALEPRDEEDGLSERMVQKNSQYQREREQRPRFPPPGSFEAEYGQRWKELYAMEKARKSELDAQLLETRQRLEGEMDLAFQDYQTAQLREDLRRRQEELDRLEASKRERMEMFGRPSGGGGGGQFGGSGFGGPLSGRLGPELGAGNGMGGMGGGPKAFGAPPDLLGFGGGGGGMGGGDFGQAAMGMDGGHFGDMGADMRDGGVNELVKMFKEDGPGGFGAPGAFAQDGGNFGGPRGGPGPDYAQPKRRRR